MTDRVPSGLLVSGAIGAALTLGYLAYSRPWYFTSQTNLGAVLGLEILIVAVWLYRRVFFLVVVLSFLLAGSNLQYVTGWTRIRWVVLLTGAFVGLLIVLKDGGPRFQLFDLFAIFGVLGTFISASVSRYPTVALLKGFSMLLLFVYAGTGARIAATERERRFVLGLVTGCEVLVGATALSYAVGHNAWGNPNSLGALMAFVSPLLLWGALLGGRLSVQRRRLILYVLCVYLVFYSHSRASIGAVLVSSGLLLLVLRKYKVAIEGTVVLVIVVSAVSIYRPDAAPSLASSVIYKNAATGILTSRTSPWQEAVANISNNPWFGTGLGTTSNGYALAEGQGMFASYSEVTTEHGSSYLAVLSGVGLVGALPFFVMLIILVVKIVRTVSWTWTSRISSHPAVPLAMLILAAILHAAFEDWMFAAGNYLCVFFWSVAFIFVDLAPKGASHYVSPSGTQLGQLGPTQATHPQ